MTYVAVGTVPLHHFWHSNYPSHDPTNLLVLASVVDLLWKSVASVETANRPSSLVEDRCLRVVLARPPDQPETANLGCVDDGGDDR